MKKVISFILTILIISLLTCSVNATTTFSTNVQANKETIKAGEQIEVVLSLSDFTAGEKGINVIVAELDYDTALFKEVYTEDIKPVENWGEITYNTVNHMLVTDANTFVTANHQAIKVVLTAKEDISETVATIVGFKNIVASDSEQDITVEDAYDTITIQKNPNASNSSAATKSSNKFDIKILIIAVIAVAIFAVVFIEMGNKRIKKGKKK